MDFLIPKVPSKNRMRVNWRRGRARLAGVYDKLPIAIVASIAGIVLFIYGWINITPKTVWVSGYSTSNGRSVGSYMRRPPGSVPRDAPYETARFIGFILILSGGIFSLRTINKYYNALDDSLLPPILENIPKPIKISVPNKKAKARKEWNCIVCNGLIVKDSFYYYDSFQKLYSGRIKYCSSCRMILIQEKESNDSKYKQQMKLYINARERQYEKYFGPVDPNYKSNYFSI